MNTHPIQVYIYIYIFKTIKIAKHHKQSEEIILVMRITIVLKKLLNAIVKDSEKHNKSQPFKQAIPNIQETY